MRYLLDCVYLLILILASPWLFYAAWRHGKYRRGLRQKLLGLVPRLECVEHQPGTAGPSGPAAEKIEWTPRAPHTCRPRIWFHAVSVGEVNLLEPLLDRVQQWLPNGQCVISSTTQTGYELAKRKYPEHPVMYCPLDFSWAVRNALRRIRPNLLVLVELELWPNLLSEAKRQGVRVAIVNGRLSDNSFRGYQRLRPLLRGWLRAIHGVAAQSSQCRDRFIALGVPSNRVRDVGSVKFDGAATDRHNPRTAKLVKLAGLQGDQLVFLAGSTQAPEESLAIETFRELKHEFPQLYLILVPRHPTRFGEVATLLDRTKLPWQRRSQLVEHRSFDARILLVDTVGELGAWWGRADIGFVGGTMGRRGGQNMLEPAGFGVPISFGPHTWNFRDVVEMLTMREAAVVVTNGHEITEFVRKCLLNTDFRYTLGARARQSVQEHKGAADRTVEMLSSLFL